MNIFESLVVLNVELNHIVELMGLAYSQGFECIANEVKTKEKYKLPEIKN